jgi:hypothetical protein
VKRQPQAIFAKCQSYLKVDAVVLSNVWGLTSVAAETPDGHFIRLISEGTTTGQWAFAIPLGVDNILAPGQSLHLSLSFGGFFSVGGLSVQSLTSLPS